jgi:mannose/fructose-specific phosphotransferase system component IIA
MSSEPVRGLVVSHASLAEGLVQSVRQIAGVEPDALRAVSNEGCGPETLLRSVSEALGDGPVIVFTDMPSGSCAFAARRITLDRPDTAVVCGVNLPMLLDFVFHRELSLPELVDRLVSKGKAAITGSCREMAPHADRAASR